MKGNIRSKIIIGILLMVFLIINTNVYAANDSFETTLTADKTQAKAEDTITITMGLSNIAIESGEKGIGAYTGHIKFDSSVLEYVSTNGTDKWDAPFYENGLITATTKDGKVVNTQQSIGTITFKVKKDAKLEETTIELENFSGTTGGIAGVDVSTGNKSVKITIVGNDSNKDDTNKNNTNNNVVNGGNSGSNNNNNNSGNSSNGSNKSVNNTNKDNIKKGVLPKAGDSNVVIFIAIGGAILLAIVLYFRVKK